jgi:hypothetical protein
VLSRLKRRADYDPEQLVNSSKFSRDAENKKALQYIAILVEGCMIGTKMNIGASVFNDVLRSIGGYRPKNNAVFKESNGSNIIYEVSKMVALDPEFVLKNDGEKLMLWSQVSVAVGVSVVV